MLHTAKGRVLAVTLLLTSLAVLCPLYAQQPVNPELGVYADDNEFTETPERYIGDTVVTGGIVQQVSPLIIELETTQGQREITITDSAFRPEVGDKVRVFGTLTAAGRVQSQSGFAVPQTGRWYAWGISFLAGLWVLTRLIRHWRIDWARIRFQRRERPLSLRDIYQIPTSLDGDRDA
ncbi:MAG: hypothetical protein J07HQW2_02239 [Haloquadratum walsbyi J07HQW2]|uniref:Uncharacterized protein n=1 Tax=Haloquadratum walsbyi J07HQW2 TaxID=1238425 RepID=U1MZ36_9EURY|nr:MAG: hypothetical protein J07HQW2_02239 [Haloquadratum walsbyi J07HQW2]